MQPNRAPSLNAAPTAEQAAKWLQTLIQYVGPGFHPDTPFADYIDADGSRCFSPAEARTLSRQLGRAARAIRQSGRDIYAIGLAAQRRMLLRANRTVRAPRADSHSPGQA